MAKRTQTPKTKAMRKVLRIYFDNARPQLPQLPYSPDISPCDFFLFGFIESKPTYYKCKSLYEQNKTIEEIYSKIEKKIWKDVFHSWKKRP